MIGRFVGVVVMLVAALLVPNIPVQAVPVTTTCVDASKTALDVDEFGHFSLNYKNIYRARLKYQYCKWETSSDSGSYHVLENYRISLTLYESKSCAFGDWDEYRINVHPLGPTNPPTKSWDCENGKGKYLKVHDLNNRILGSGATDRCFKFNWKAVWSFHADKTGESNSRCLGGGN